MRAEKIKKFSSQVFRGTYYCLTNLWWSFAPNNVIIQRNAFLFNIWKQPSKGVRKTDSKTPSSQAILKNWNFTSHSLHYRRFPANILKAFKKHRSAVLKNSTRAKSFLVWKEKQTSKLTRKLSSFFRIKCFLFFKSICKWLSQHSLSTVKYCNLYMSVLYQSLIQSIVKNLRWSFLRKVFTAFGRQWFSENAPL